MCITGVRWPIEIVFTEKILSPVWSISILLIYIAKSKSFY